MSEQLNRAIEQLNSIILTEGINPKKGLPQELFLFATTLILCPNVDLFITDNKNRVLLTWRDDPFYGQGWHIPGGCIRLGETCENRIQETAKKEIGTEVIVDMNHVITRELIISENRPMLQNQLERSHNILILYHCELPVGFEIRNNSSDEHSSGYLKWFDRIPDDFLNVHKMIYGEIMESFFIGELKWKM